jgi:hypothetical protein
VFSISASLGVRFAIANQPSSTQSHSVYNSHSSHADHPLHSAPSLHSAAATAAAEMLRSSLSSPNLRIYNAIEASRFHPFQESDVYEPGNANGLTPITHAHAGRVIDLLSRSPQPSPTIGGGYVLSSNPPEKSIKFRLGDWVCESNSNSSTNGCGAHNFSRNDRCIGCGRSRPPVSSLSSSSSPSPVRESGLGLGLGSGEVSPVIILPVSNTLPSRGEFDNQSLIYQKRYRTHTIIFIAHAIRSTRGT